MKGQRHEGEDPGVIAGHRPAAPENVQRPMFFDAPGGEIGRPACRALDLNLDIGKEKGQQDDPEQSAGQVAPESAGRSTHFRSATAAGWAEPLNTCCRTCAAACGCPRLLARWRNASSSAEEESSRWRR